MDTKSLDTYFGRMGARVQVLETDRGRVRRSALTGVALDVREDREGEFFEVRVPPGSDADLIPVNVQPKDRHLLLLLREDGRTSKFLCGHDERHWFVAAVPDNGAGTVKAAMDALKPREVHTAQARAGVTGRRRYRRKNAASVRL